MEFRGEKRCLGKLEYVLIAVLAVVIVWAAWIMLEPVIRPAIDRVIQMAFEEIAATPTPAP